MKNSSNKPRLPIEIRKGYDHETNFIYNSWIKSGHRSRTHEIIAKELYTLNQHDVITHVLARANVIVAQELDKPESLYGYLVYQWLDGVFVVHYAYTKQVFRSLGVLSSLLQYAGFEPQQSAGFYTHTTKAAHAIDTKLNLIYNPYIIINPKYEVLTSQPKARVYPPEIPAAAFFDHADSVIDETMIKIIEENENGEK